MFKDVNLIKKKAWKDFQAKWPKLYDKWFILKDKWKVLLLE
jgi:hypothetical protein